MSMSTNTEIRSISRGRIQKFTDLIAWQKAHLLTLRIYHVTKLFPTDERFGLVDQVRRAAVSVEANIAEGYGRGTAKDKIQFYYIAHGSICEVQSHLLVARDLGYITVGEELNELTEEVGRLITGLIKSSPEKPAY